RRDTLRELDCAHVEPQAAEQPEITGPRAAEAEVRSGDDDLGADRPQDPLCELLGAQPRELERELDDERLVAPRRLQQPEPSVRRSVRQCPPRAAAIART